MSALSKTDGPPPSPCLNPHRSPHLYNAAKLLTSKTSLSISLEPSRYHCEPLRGWKLSIIFLLSVSSSSSSPSARTHPPLILLFSWAAKRRPWLQMARCPLAVLLFGARAKVSLLLYSTVRSVVALLRSSFLPFFVVALIFPLLFFLSPLSLPLKLKNANL